MSEQTRPGAETRAGAVITGENLGQTLDGNPAVKHIVNKKVSEALWTSRGWVVNSTDALTSDAGGAKVSWVDATNATLSGATAEILDHPEVKALWNGEGWTTVSGITATGATAGSPGSFTPAGADPPADLAAMSGITANPATAWTTGEHVVLGDSSSAYWNGTAWTAGSAP
jgi:hypothetical protein